MATVAQRLAKLEDRVGGSAGRQIVVSVEGETSEDVVKAWLRSEGVAVSPRDDLVLFQTVYEDRAGQAMAATRPPRLLSVRPR